MRLFDPRTRGPTGDMSEDRGVSSESSVGGKGGAVERGSVCVRVSMECGDHCRERGVRRTRVKGRDLHALFSKLYASEACRPLQHC
jgi:hypothetical protein